MAAGWFCAMRRCPADAIRGKTSLGHGGAVPQPGGAVPQPGGAVPQPGGAVPQPGVG